LSGAATDDAAYSIVSLLEKGGATQAFTIRTIA